MSRFVFLAMFAVACSSPPSAPASAPGASAVGSEITSAPLRPVGIYAHIDLTSVLNKSSAYNHQNELCQLFNTLLSDPGVAGLTMGVHWDKLAPSPSPAPYDWQVHDTGCTGWVYAKTDPPATEGSALTGAFDLAVYWGKTIRMNVSPGFHTPGWVLDELGSCDYLFPSPTPTPLPEPSPGTSCGYVSFSGYPEEVGTAPSPLPLPWNGTYQAEYTHFLGDLNAQFGATGPWGPAMVSISIAGPMGASPEMILPSSTDPGTTGPNGWNVNDVWLRLFQVTGLPLGQQNTDYPFIYAWKKAIRTHNNIFKGITLVLTPDNGERLPDIGPSPSPSLSPAPDAPNNFWATQCVADPSWSCAAVTSVITDFVGIDTSTSNNLLATQTGGLIASQPLTLAGTDVGPPGVRALTSPAPWPQIIGGDEFDHAVSNGTLSPQPSPAYQQQTGCLKPTTFRDPYPCPGITPEQGLYNVFSTFFSGTPYACQFARTDGASQPGSATLSYLEVEWPDIVYAVLAEDAKVCSAYDYDDPGSTQVSANYLLELANFDLAKMSNAPLPPSPQPRYCSELPSSCP